MAHFNLPGVWTTQFTVRGILHWEACSDVWNDDCASRVSAVLGKEHWLSWASVCSAHVTWRAFFFTHNLLATVLGGTRAWWCARQQRFYSFIFINILCSDTELCMLKTVSIHFDMACSYNALCYIVLSFMMVGDPFGTKTSVIQCLADTLTLLKERDQLDENKVSPLKRNHPFCFVKEGGELRIIWTYE